MRDDGQMMIIFLPWCPVDKEYAGNGIRLIPYSNAAPVGGASEHEAITKIFAIYRDLRGRPIKQAALVQYQDRPLTADLGEAELREVFEFVELACFAALAKRDFFREPGFYCNRDHFTCFAQSFNDSPEMVVFETPWGRGAGTRLSGWSLDKPLIITVPEHVPLNQKITVDGTLLKALVSLQAKLRGSNSHKEQKKWGRWRASVECFNWANTDRSFLPYTVEWVLMCGAFERILDAESKAEDIVEKFTNILVPPAEIKASSSGRKSAKFRTNADFPLRQEWMREFYRLRDNLAHGWLEPCPQQPAAWLVGEHLTLARLAFPLIVKVLLENEGLYQLTQEDKTWLSAFEEVADAQFLERSETAVEGEDSVVEKIRQRHFWKVVKTEVLVRMERLSQKGRDQDGRPERGNGGL
ncbi:hypothetical protein PTH_0861 [Pelotomaculum thermopropionicum SI]|uniref:Apea-like HEPN domain-containing protein n=1 Tax=Pelotomaculum thermopropionicum (strain DSM 13744 / JCM 10971 / SI) TaxID=370438 RepID=A5D3Z9_PELTS|nr:hypothetical protein PTH_0861 [Pelotomaculum thermopropionicum SI]